MFPSQHRCDEFVLCTNNKPEAEVQEGTLLRRQPCRSATTGPSALQPAKFLMTHMIGTTPGSEDTQCISCSSCLDKPIYPGSIHSPSLEKQRRPSSSAGKKSNKTKGSGNGKGKGKGEGRSDNEEKKKGHKELAAASVRSVCPKARGLFAHADSCHKFYQCYDGEVLMKTCPDGLLFDSDKHECAYAKEVECGERKAKSEYASKYEYDP
ncbi:hypothetical protein CDAR_603951 [Caerostris darwini]|uniref:Chitin-binding type-2 domain-containing protein n=1 Tax=Caerostris darwini TaxID=1538125 RepID=A0AAV4R517_9ARAC|nr:hypothetical protein CDAR_603951 [Caerostris darwini]